MKERKNVVGLIPKLFELRMPCQVSCVSLCKKDKLNNAESSDCCDWHFARYGLMWNTCLGKLRVTFFFIVFQPKLEFCQ